MFIAALFRIAKKKKQPKSPSTDEWINKVWSVYTMKYYSAIKMNEGVSLVSKESSCQCRGLGFDPWATKIPLAVQQLSLSTTTTVLMLWSPCAATTEACMPWNLCSAMRSLCTATREQPPITTTREKSKQQ